MKGVRCTECRYYRGGHGLCMTAGKVAGGRWKRTCSHYKTNRITTDELRARIVDAGLAHHLLELADTPEGRMLRLRLNVPEAVRFQLYELAGLRVTENNPLIVGRGSKGHRQHGGTPDQSDPKQTRAA